MWTLREECGGSRPGEEESIWAVFQSHEEVSRGLILVNFRVQILSSHLASLGLACLKAITYFFAFSFFFFFFSFLFFLSDYMGTKLPSHACGSIERSLSMKSDVRHDVDDYFTTRHLFSLICTWRPVTPYRQRHSISEPIPFLIPFLSIDEASCKIYSFFTPRSISYTFLASFRCLASGPCLLA